MKSTKLCSVSGCEAVVCAKRLCRKHYDAARVKDENYREKHYERKVRRRLKLKGVKVDRVYRRVVWERDKGICGLCGRRVDLTLRYPDPHSPSLDHILPISKGGVHSYENVQLAHLGCNVGKGNRVMEPVAVRGVRIVKIKGKKKKIDIRMQRDSGLHKTELTKGVVTMCNSHSNA